MANFNDNQELDMLFEALANKHRREILYSLSLQPNSITQLALQRHLSLPAIHKHILSLEKAGIVTRKKIGQTNFLSINRHSLRNLQDWIIQYHPYWGNDKETLENYSTYLKGKKIYTPDGYKKGGEAK